MTIDELRIARFKLLKHLYDFSGGDLHKWFDLEWLGSEVGIEPQVSQQIGDYLLHEQLIAYRAFGPTITITHSGVKQVEAALSKPDTPTRYFPPVNVINIHHMENSSIQQASANATQIVLPGGDVSQKLGPVMQMIQDSLNRLGLTDDGSRELLADVTTIQAQLASSKPKASVVSECLLSIRETLESVPATAATAEILAKLVAAIGK